MHVIQPLFIGGYYFEVFVNSCIKHSLETIVQCMKLHTRYWGSAMHTSLPLFSKCLLKSS